MKSIPKVIPWIVLAMFFCWVRSWLCNLLQYAKDCGFNLGRVLVLRHKTVTELDKEDVETWRKRYQVVPRYRHVMVTCANASRPYWLKWYEMNYEGHHPGPQRKGWGE